MEIIVELISIPFEIQFVITSLFKMVCEHYFMQQKKRTSVRIRFNHATIVRVIRGTETQIGKYAMRFDATSFPFAFFLLR